MTIPDIPLPKLSITLPFLYRIRLSAVTVWYTGLGLASPMSILS